MDSRSSELISAPTRVHVGDMPIDVLGFALEAWENGSLALVTLVEIRGGAARSLGAQLAVAGDGRYCGYVSGGCVEAAAAFEALQAIAEGRDRIVLFGEGSPFFDIALPCGGGISVAIHVVRDIAPLKRVLERLSEREPVGLRYSYDRQSLVVSDMPDRSGWSGAEFLVSYHPATQIVISGRGSEAEAVARIATASGWSVVQMENLKGQRHAKLDEYTAIVLLHHDLNSEQESTKIALGSQAFYIGALGSTRTHRRRSEMLLHAGYAAAAIERIRAPIGIFGPARDSTSLALSILADIAACRLSFLE